MASTDCDTQRPWIDAEQAQPARGLGRVLVYGKDGISPDPYCSVETYDQVWGWSGRLDVTHWCLLPPLPTEEDERREAQSD